MLGKIELVVVIPPLIRTPPVCNEYPMFKVPDVTCERIYVLADVVLVKRLFTPVTDVPYIVVLAETALFEELPIVIPPVVFVNNAIPLAGALPYIEFTFNCPLTVAFKVTVALPVKVVVPVMPIVDPDNPMFIVDALPVHILFIPLEPYILRVPV
jgi:hypothetical protein